MPQQAGKSANRPCPALPLSGRQTFSLFFSSASEKQKIVPNTSLASELFKSPKSNVLPKAQGALLTVTPYKNQNTNYKFPTYNGTEYALPFQKGVTKAQ